MATVPIMSRRGQEGQPPESGSSRREGAGDGGEEAPPRDSASNQPSMNQLIDQELEQALAAHPNRGREGGGDAIDESERSSGSTIAESFDQGIAALERQIEDATLRRRQQGQPEGRALAVQQVAGRRPTGRGRGRGRRRGSGRGRGRGRGRGMLQVPAINLARREGDAAGDGSSSEEEMVAMPGEEDSVDTEGTPATGIAQAFDQDLERLEAEIEAEAAAAARPPKRARGRPPGAKTKRGPWTGKGNPANSNSPRRRSKARRVSTRATAAETARIRALATARQQRSRSNTPPVPTQSQRKTSNSF